MCSALTLGRAGEDDRARRERRALREERDGLAHAEDLVPAKNSGYAFFTEQSVSYLVVPSCTVSPFRTVLSGTFCGSLIAFADTKQGPNGVVLSTYHMSLTKSCRRGLDH